MRDRRGSVLCERGRSQHTPNKSALPLGRAGWNCAIGVKGQSERRAAAPLSNGTGAASTRRAALSARHSLYAMVLMRPARCLQMGVGLCSERERERERDAFNIHATRHRVIASRVHLGLLISASVGAERVWWMLEMDQAAHPAHESTHTLSVSMTAYLQAADSRLDKSLSTKMFFNDSPFLL
jgi:hypothetical protein